MKARIPPKRRFDSKTVKDMQEMVKQEFERFTEQEMASTDRRYKKLFAICLSMNEKQAESYGVKGWKDPWGKHRINKLLDMVETVSDYLDTNDEIAWKHMDSRLDQIGVMFEHEKNL